MLQPINSGVAAPGLGSEVPQVGGLHGSIRNPADARFSCGLRRRFDGHVFRHRLASHDMRGWLKQFAESVDDLGSEGQRRRHRNLVRWLLRPVACVGVQRDRCDSAKSLPAIAKWKPNHGATTGRQHRAQSCRYLGSVRARRFGFRFLHHDIQCGVGEAVTATSKFPAVFPQPESKQP